MIQELKDKIGEIYDNILRLNPVLPIFNDFYGEDKVDIQCSISKEQVIHELSSPLMDRANVASRLYNKAVTKNIWSTFEVTLIKTALDSGVLEEEVSDNPFLLKYLLPDLIEEVIKYDVYILVFFPEVRVTNEFDKYIDIQELWVKVYIKPDGASNGYFNMNRSRYSEDQWNSDYLHSHINGISDPPGKFLSPCLGTGPIRSTLITLTEGYKESIWKLFCLELSRYVETESVSGTPYRMLESVHKPTKYTKYTNSVPIRRFLRGIKLDPIFVKYIWSEFIPHLLSTRKIKFIYHRGNYELGMSIMDFALLVSNEFISWYNHKFYNSGDLLSSLFPEGLELFNIGYYKDKEFFIPEDSSATPIPSDTPIICTFKGKTIRRTINPSQETFNTVRVLKLCYIYSIAHALLLILNHKYGKERNLPEGDSTQTTYI